MRRALAASILLLTLGCGDPAPEDSIARDSAAQRARDSALGASGLPGATGIGGALRAADSAAARRLREDSVSRSP